MVVAKEFKKSEVAYERLGDIAFINSSTSVIMPYVNSFDESDLEILIETYFPADELRRGWVGDIYFEATCGMDATTGADVNATYRKCIKDVLLARVNSYKDGPECVLFTYTFLKY